MDTVREGEKGVTRKQRSKSIDHLNASQVKRVVLEEVIFFCIDEFALHYRYQGL